MAFVEPVTLRGAHVVARAACARARAATQRGGGRRRAVAALVHERSRAPEKTREWIDAALDDARALGRDAVRRPRACERRHRRQHALFQRRCAAPPARDRPHVVREARSAHGDQHRSEAACCSRTRSRRSRCIAVEFRTQLVEPRSRARRSRGSARSWTACCATTSCMPDGSLRDTVVFSIIDARVAGA